MPDRLRTPYKAPRVPVVQITRQDGVGSHVIEVAIEGHVLWAEDRMAPYRVPPPMVTTKSGDNGGVRIEWFLESAIIEDRRMPVRASRPLSWYLRQTIPLPYRTEYRDAKLRVHLATGWEWLGRCFGVKDVVLDSWYARGERRRS